MALVPELGAADPPGGVRLTSLPMRRRTRIAFRRGAGTHPAVVALTTALRAGVAPSPHGLGPAPTSPPSPTSPPAPASIPAPAPSPRP
nr:hypothetical protein GCM10020093_034660 [Planobispora longispora]